MARKASPLEVTSNYTQDPDHLQALVNFKTEKCDEGIFTSGSFERENMDELDSMVAMMVADIVSNEESSPPRAEAPADYNTNNSWIYDALFVQCHELSGDGNQHYDPESTVTGNAATRDMSACQILSPTTSLLKSVAKASSSSSQKVGEDASRRKELRLIKNRQAAKESRRRKKEYIKYLEACASMLQLQNTKLREEINYMKGVSGDKKQ